MAPTRNIVTPTHLPAQHGTRAAASSTSTTRASTRGRKRPAVNQDCVSTHPETVRALDDPTQKTVGRISRQVLHRRLRRCRRKLCDFVLMFDDLAKAAKIDWAVEDTTTTKTATRTAKNAQQRLRGKNGQWAKQRQPDLASGEERVVGDDANCHPNASAKTSGPGSFVAAVGRKKDGTGWRQRGEWPTGGFKEQAQHEKKQKQVSIEQELTQVRSQLQTEVDRNTELQLQVSELTETNSQLTEEVTELTSRRKAVIEGKPVRVQQDAQLQTEVRRNTEILKQVTELTETERGVAQSVTELMKKLSTVTGRSQILQAELSTARVSAQAAQDLAAERAAHIEQLKTDLQEADDGVAIWEESAHLQREHLLRERRAAEAALKEEVRVVTRERDHLRSCSRVQAISEGAAQVNPAVKRPTVRKAPAVRKVPVQKPAKKRPAPFGKKEDKHRWDQGMGGEPDGGQVYGRHG